MCLDHLLKMQIHKNDFFLFFNYFIIMNCSNNPVGRKIIVNGESQLQPFIEPIDAINSLINLGYTEEDFKNYAIFEEAIKINQNITFKKQSYNGVKNGIEELEYEIMSESEINELDLEDKKKLLHSLYVIITYMKNNEHVTFLNNISNIIAGPNTNGGDELRNDFFTLMNFL